MVLSIMSPARMASSNSEALLRGQLTASPPEEMMAAKQVRESRVCVAPAGPNINTHGAIKT